MNNKPPGKISLNLGGLKLGSSSKAFDDSDDLPSSKPKLPGGSGYKTFGKPSISSNATPSSSNSSETMGFGSFVSKKSTEMKKTRK